MQLGMGKKLHYIIILTSLIAAASAVKAQDTTSLDGLSEISLFSIDSKGNFYVADKEHSLIKYAQDGSEITRVNIKAYGEISSIDCSNPFEIYVFYQDQNIIVYYDNMLNFRGETRLNDYFFSNVSCIARSFDNNVWILDLSEFKMLKINKKGDVLLETPYLNNILSNNLNPFKIWESQNALYVADSVNGVYAFDMLGTYNTKYYINNITNVAQSQQNFYYQSNDQIYTYNRLTREPVALKYNTFDSYGLAYYNGRLFTFSTNNLISYPAE